MYNKDLSSKSKVNFILVPLRYKNTIGNVHMCNWLKRQHYIINKTKCPNMVHRSMQMHIVTLMR